MKGRKWIGSLHCIWDPKQMLLIFTWLLLLEMNGWNWNGSISRWIVFASLADSKWLLLSLESHLLLFSRYLARFLSINDCVG